MTSDEIDDVCQLAQALAKNCGYHVFPCRMPDKEPAIAKRHGGNGFHDASTDPDVIADLWRRGPGDLIGIRTGETSGVDVLDIDVKHKTAVAWWEAAAPRIPPTRLYRTKGGGIHAHFQHAQNVECNRNKLAYGVDVRADGGYIISWFAHGLECLDDSPPAPWPDWLLECLLWERKPEPIPVNLQAVSADKAIEGVLRVVSGAREGERNGCLFWAACRLHERITAGHIGQQDAAGLLVAAARSVGLHEIEARRTVASAWKRTA